MGLTQTREEVMMKRRSGSALWWSYKNSLGGSNFRTLATSLSLRVPDFIEIAFLARH